MLIDNQNKEAIKWIEEDTKAGRMDIVTGYFTVGALVWLAAQTNNQIHQYRYILGDIVNTGNIQDRPLDLLNETLTISNAIDVHRKAAEAVEFLKLDKVHLKTLEPNFCHAKLYLNRADSGKANEGYFITGSSNLTESGFGMHVQHNVELNIGGHPSSPDFKGLADWFDELWSSPQAHAEKTIVDAHGKKSKKDFKAYLIDEISRIYREYQPRELYYKVLFELFGDQMDELENPEFARQIGKLESRKIFRDLYEFQQKGVIGLIRMLQKYRGAILADAVGLGKTWSALAVIKFFMMEKHEIVLICPKKLEHNWRMYLRRQNSRFEEEQFDYLIRYHTDLHEALMSRKTDTSDKLFKRNRPRLFVIDESHNLRNDKSARYQFLVEQILRHNEGAKVLLLSATPINNTLNDVRNQFKLLVNGRNDGFAENLDVRNLEATFRLATRAFREWVDAGPSPIGELIQNLPDRFVHLTDSLILARNRKWVKSQHAGLHFPQKATPVNLFITPEYIGNYESFEELFRHFPPFLSGYQPAFYTRPAGPVKKTEDERQRQYFLARMMYILMVKRLESCWASFESTVKTMAAHHQNALDRILAYEKDKKDHGLNIHPQTALFMSDEDEEWQARLEGYTLGKGENPVHLSEIDEAGMLKAYKQDLKRDLEAFQSLQSNLSLFREDIDEELHAGSHSKSADTKLQKLMELIRDKQASRKNANNQKVLIFTTYADTARYLYDQLSRRGFTRIAMVSGDTALAADVQGNAREIEGLLERFAPFTKLFHEKDWEGWSPSRDDLSQPEQYAEWISWIQEFHLVEWSKLQRPIDILIATDILSEGQNLQDCDTVVNYDIHWNPVRIIQRFGRIDRLGSPNETVYGINFWPSDNINNYLSLQRRIEQRMAAMKLAGGEVPHDITENFRRIAEDEALEQRQTERMMQHMQHTWDDIEVSEQTLGFDNLSLEPFRQDLAHELDAHKDYYRRMPNGLFSGFLHGGDSFKASAIIALLGHPAGKRDKESGRYPRYQLICLDESGRQLLGNQKEVLDVLAAHKEAPRHVPESIDKGDATSLRGWSKALEIWIAAQAVTESIAEDGTKTTSAGPASLDLVKRLQSGSSHAVLELRETGAPSDQYKPESFDLITWFILSPDEAE